MVCLFHKPSYRWQNQLSRFQSRLQSSEHSTVQTRKPVAKFTFSFFYQTDSLVPVKTGFLRESIITKAMPNGFKVFPSASYARFVDQGTKPHTIFPREARVLRWYSPSGAPVFSRYAQHPGTKGAFFTQKTAEAMPEVLRQLYVMIWREQQ